MGKGMDILKGIWIQFSQLSSKKFTPVNIATRETLFYRTLQKWLCDSSSKTIPLCPFLWDNFFFFFYYIEFCHLGSWYMFFRYSSNLYMSKQNFTIFSLYALHILIKIFLGISYFVAIVKNIFFLLNCLHVHCWYIQKLLIFVYLFNSYYLFWLNYSSCSVKIDIF